MKSPESQKPYSEYYNKGLLARKELITLTEPLRYFLKRNDIPITHPYYSDTLGLSSGVCVIPSARGREFKYRVDSEIAQVHINEFRALAQDIRERRSPSRTEDEKLYFQSRLLRRKSDNETYQAITIDEAYEELITLGKKIANRERLVQEAEDIAMQGIEKVLPHLRGEVGDFLDFHYFLGYHKVVVQHTVVDFYLRKRRETKTLHHYSREVDFGQAHEGEKKNEIPEFDLTLQKALGEMPDIDIRVFILRGTYRYPFPVIAAELNTTPAAARERYRRILDKLFPNRQKGPGGSANAQNREICAAYASFAHAFLLKHGRKPLSKDMVQAYKKGKFPYSKSLLLIRFGNGSWSWEKTRENMEQMLEQEKQTVPSG